MGGHQCPQQDLNSGTSEYQEKLATTILHTSVRILARDYQIQALYFGLNCMLQSITACVVFTVSIQPSSKDRPCIDGRGQLSSVEMSSEHNSVSSSTALLTVMLYTMDLHPLLLQKSSNDRVVSFSGLSRALVCVCVSIQ